MSDGEDHEVFTFIAYRWDVTEGLRLAEAREPVMCPVSELSQILNLIWIDDDHVSKADLSRPLLAVQVDDLGAIVIDGWHRIAKAVRTGVAMLPVIVLTNADERKIRVSGGTK